jgi:predicted nucleotidyltransferase
LFLDVPRDIFESTIVISSADIILNKITAALKEEFKPTRLFLYGSNGTHRPDSDYDLVMVLPEFDSTGRYKTMAAISSKLWKELDVEVQVLRPH